MDANGGVGPYLTAFQSPNVSLACVRFAASLAATAVMFSTWSAAAVSMRRRKDMLVAMSMSSLIVAHCIPTHTQCQTRLTSCAPVSSHASTRGQHAPNVLITCHSQLPFRHMVEKWVALPLYRLS